MKMSKKCYVVTRENAVCERNQERKKIGVAQREGTAVLTPTTAPKKLRMMTMNAATMILY